MYICFEESVQALHAAPFLSLPSCGSPSLASTPIRIHHSRAIERTAINAVIHTMSVILTHANAKTTIDIIHAHADIGAVVISSEAVIPKPPTKAAARTVIQAHTRTPTSTTLCASTVVARVSAFSGCVAMGRPPVRPSVSAGAAAAAWAALTVDIIEDGHWHCSPSYFTTNLYHITNLCVYVNIDMYMYISLSVGLGLYCCWNERCR